MAHVFSPSTQQAEARISVSSRNLFYIASSRLELNKTLLKNKNKFKQSVSHEVRLACVKNLQV